MNATSIQAFRQILRLKPRASRPQQADDDDEYFRKPSDLRRSGGIPAAKSVGEFGSRDCVSRMSRRNVNIHRVELESISAPTTAQGDPVPD